MCGERVSAVFKRGLCSFIHDLLSARLVALARRLQAAGTTLSPRAYPHAAEDIIAAVLHFLPFTRTAPREPLSLSGRTELRISADRRDQPGVESSRLRVAVWSAISPWVECTIMFGTLPSQLPRFANASLTTVDYNEPIVPELATSPHAGSTSSTTRLAHEPWRARFRTLDQSSLAHHYAAGERFDVIVSFSGIEHDGLGRCACIAAYSHERRSHSPLDVSPYAFQHSHSTMPFHHAIPPHTALPHTYPRLAVHPV